MEILPRKEPAGPLGHRGSPKIVQSRPHKVSSVESTIALALNVNYTKIFRFAYPYFIAAPNVLVYRFSFTHNLIRYTTKPVAQNWERINMQPFHIAATGYSLNYLPEYIALRHGFFREQGLDVTVHIPTPWDGVLDALADGSATMCLGGIWVPSMYRNRVQSYTVFAQIANRAPLALIRRASDKCFKLSEVAGRTVLVNSSGGASFGFFFKMLLRENGVDARSVDYIQDLGGEMLGNLFQGGMGDYFVTDSLSAQAMVACNSDVAIAMHMITQDDVPWSVYYRETATITPEILDAQKRFFIALQKGIDWVLLHDAESFQDELSELFPNIPIDVAVSVTNDFRRNGMWTTTSVPRGGYDRWQLGLRDACLITEPIVYEDLVDNAPSAAAQISVKASS